jgi:hypothetical protein
LSSLAFVSAVARMIDGMFETYRAGGSDALTT